MGRVKRNNESRYDSPFATRLRELLDTPKISQAKVAEFVGVTRQAISSYSLGTSVPDIDKLVKIAAFFEVSTEYLLGHTEIKKVDPTKQAVAEYLNLTEEAIDKIKLLRYGHLEQHFADDYKLTTKLEPLADIFNDWIESVNLSKLLSDLHRSLIASMRFDQSGKYPERYQLDEEGKQAACLIEDMGYVLLDLQEQINFYTQSAITEFQKSIDKLMDKTTKAVIELNKPNDNNDKKYNVEEIE